MSRYRNDRPAGPLSRLIVLLAAALAAGCTTAANNAGGDHIDAGGKSISGWVTATGASLHSKAATREYLATGSTSCTGCHGDNLRGGISGVSCMTSSCHHNDGVTGWGQPAVHGKSAKKAPGSSGFASCRVCHGADFAGGLSGTSCFGCHKPGANVPHPARPWMIPGATVTTDNTHTNARSENAPVCDLCHHRGRNFTGTLSVPAPAGTPPGCFNGTLCHAAAAPHATNGSFLPPAAHGAAAKQDLSFCQECHGTPGTILFAGGVSSVKCADCHADAKAHPTDWQGSGTYSHRTSGNRAAACTICHDGEVRGRPAPNPASPGCFSASFTNASRQARACHSNGPGQPNHAVPFLAAAHTGATTTAFNADCANCHAGSGSSPVSTAPLCSECHRNTAVDPLTTKNCRSCHANPPDNASTLSFPNVAGAHFKHLNLNNGAGTVIACATCHNGLDNGTLNHYDRANGRAGHDALRIPPGDVAFGGYAALTSTRVLSWDNGSLTCANLRCHGGLATPSWRGGTLSSCTDCHTSSGQYNSYTSGEHTRHLNAGLGCTECHDMSSGTAGGLNHYANLVTTALEGPAWTTFRNSTGVTYTHGTPGSGNCTGICHTKDHQNVPW